MNFIPFLFRRSKWGGLAVLQLAVIWGGVHCYPTAWSAIRLRDLAECLRRVVIELSVLSVVEVFLLGAILTGLLVYWEHLLLAVVSRNKKFQRVCAALVTASGDVDKDEINTWKFSRGWQKLCRLVLLVITSTVYPVIRMNEFGFIIGVLASLMLGAMLIRALNLWECIAWGLPYEVANRGCRDGNCSDMLRKAYLGS